jgi:hypothetical protein
MIHDPHRIFYANESGFPLATKAGRVLAPSGAKIDQVTTNTKVNISMLKCVLKLHAPMILFQGEKDAK